MIGNEEDFTACLGFPVEGLDHNIANIETEAVQADDPKAAAEFSQLQSPPPLCAR